MKMRAFRFFLALVMLLGLLPAGALGAEPRGPEKGGETGIADPAVPEDFENDLWLQYDFLEMKQGETAVLYPWRVEQPVGDPVTNDVSRAWFRFEVIRGSSVTVSPARTRDRAEVRAVGQGISVVKVTYEALTTEKRTYGACSPVNTAYVVYDVNDYPGELTITTSLWELRSYDTLYYTEGDTLPFSFTAEVPGARSVTVTCNGHVLEPADGTYTAQLENRSNILGIRAEDDRGRMKSYFQVVDARKMQILLENRTSPDEPIREGDRVRISFRGVTMPVYKLATIYNPCFGKDAASVVYTNDSLGTFRGQCLQYDLAVRNNFEVTFPEAGNYTFGGGHILSAWWGCELGADKQQYGPGEPNLNGPLRKGSFSRLPDFTVTVAPGKAAAEALQMARDGADGAAAWLADSKPDCRMGDEWPVFARTRSGHPLTGEQRRAYLESVEETYKGTGADLKPTTLARVTLTLGALGENGADFRGLSFTELMTSGEREMKTSNDPIFTLLALDSRNYPVPQGARWTREALREEILSYQNPDGSFCLAPQMGANGDITAMALQALAPYRDQAPVRRAVEKALSYLGAVYQGADYSTGSAETSAQLLTALTALDMDVLAGDFAREGRNLLTDIDSYRIKENGAFRHTASGNANTMATYQACYALEAYCRQAEKKNRLYDLTDVPLRAGCCRVILHEARFGTVSADTYELAPGETVTVTLVPAGGYVLTGLTVNGTDVTEEVHNETYIYTCPAQPAAEVHIRATFGPDTAPGEVMELISDIGPVTLESGEAIEAARKAYEALTEAQKAQVTNLEVLVRAEKELARLEEAEAVRAEEARQEALAILQEIPCTGRHEKQLGAIRAEAEAALLKARTVEEVLEVLREAQAALSAAAYCPSEDFRDVKADGWYHEAVDYAITKGLMKGVAADRFGIDGTLTRGQLVTVLYRAEGSPSVEGMENPFRDIVIAPQNWYAEAVIWAYNNGIVKGMSDVKFAPMNKITREQLVSILYRYNGSPAAEGTLSRFADAGRVSSYADRAMVWGVAKGIVSGIPAGEQVLLKPQGNATRAQAAAIMMRFLEGSGT